MAVKNNDFIEIEFTGKISDTGEIFDTNIEKVAKDADLETKNVKPLIMAVGHKMLPVGFDEDLDGKEEGKDYVIEVAPDKAFGKRNPQMIRMIPTKLFHEQKIEPIRGMQLSLDGQLVKILSSDRGRTLVDFNNPLAGKNITYEYKIKRLVTEQKERVDALQDFLFRRIFDFEINEKKIIFKVGKEAEPFVKMFSKKFGEILGLEIEAEIIEKKSEESK